MSSMYCRCSGASPFSGASPAPHWPWQAGVPCHLQVPRPPSSLWSTPGGRAVLRDRVTLTCQGSAAAGATTWYKDGQRWRREGRDHITVTESGTYTCDRSGSGLSPPVRILDGEGGRLVLQVPVQTLLEEHTVTLHLTFYHDGKELWVLYSGTEPSLSPRQLSHRACYSCIRGGTHAEGHVTHECHPTQIPQPVSLAASPCATTLQDPQVTYAELRGPQGRPQEPGDIYRNVL
uniref:Ig-like domain-containing protein n=1 Tax=Serinus canaria TaxID=9135 RepID=A0A8C9NSG4_SERCA